MRASSDPKDPGYGTFVSTFGGKCRVLLNGVDVSNDVTMADEELGEVLALVTGEDGVPLVEGDKFVEEILRGKVEILAIK